MDYFNQQDHYFRNDNPATNESIPVDKEEAIYFDSMLYESIDNLDTLLEAKAFVTIIFTNIAIQDELFVALSKLQTLTTLKLSFIRADTTELPESLYSITSLKVLLIDNIELTKLSSKIGNLVNLERIWIYGTKLDTLPESIANLQHLKSLEVECNRITHLPES